MTALKKPDGGVQGIVAGDVVRRLVARTMAQQLGPATIAATAPHQYALLTRSLRVRGACFARVDGAEPPHNSHVK